MTMDIRKVKKLIELLEQSGIDELEIQEGEDSVRICRYSSSAPQQQVIAAAAPVAAAPVAQAAPPPAGNPLAGGFNDYDDGPEEGHIVSSPMVGTFYAAPKPEEPPFVKVGQHVNVGDVLCTIEAMKMFNQIESDVAGVVVEVLGENGQGVEFGQGLFVISEDG